MSNSQRMPDTTQYLRQILNGATNHPISMAEAKAAIRKQFPEHEDPSLEQQILSEAAIQGRAVEF